ncbi:PucR family transcriptional regulator [Cohnella nanjingensis]|uniref:PucR family transcriptional regulator n=1 Tax=Cohnella nanjingensis TaxID=1387779 RepID=A0A7X0RZP3_9BACL|nr:PucR family transcriptional regulator [Cohnella nanjingensis]MBB6675466.1 PucR family transcriptional regulator [Cohnella nanjingensis]
MHMTVEQALSVYPLSEGRLIAGSAGRNRIVKSVNVMDAPDITDWIKEGEMLFTTAYLIKDDPADAIELLHKLNLCGASGLGIKLGRFWTAVPEALIAEADALGFPLIELPYPFTFSDQMNGLFHAEMRRSTGLLQEVLDKQVRLMRFALRSDHVRELFDTVAEVIGEPIAVVGSRGQMVYNASPADDGALLGDWPWPQYHKWVKTPGWQAFRVPLMKQGQCTGHVFFFTPRVYLSAIEESLYFQAAELLSFHLNFNYEDYFELSVQRDFGVLVKRHLKNGLSAERVTEYAKRWELDLFDGAYRCALTDYPRLAGAEARMEELEALKAEFLSHTRMQALKGTHIVMEEGLLSLFPNAADDGGDALADAFESCFAGRKADPRGEPRAAMSGRKRQVEQLAEAFGECKETHRLSGDWGIGERILKFETLDLAFIFEQVPRERMQTYCNRLLGGLMGKDPDYVQEMMRTLETYLDNDGQLNETAKKLFIHRNTATYRIEKLGELLDVDFKRINDLLRLKMVFLFRKMLSQEPANQPERLRG